MRRHVVSTAKREVPANGKDDCPDLELSIASSNHHVDHSSNHRINHRYTIVGAHIETIMQWRNKLFLGSKPSPVRIVAALIVIGFVGRTMILSRSHGSIRLLYTNSNEPWKVAGYDLSRVYPIDKEKRDWCQPTSTNSTTTASDGLLFIKVTKCASSTGAGITLNMAHNHRKSNGSDCFASVEHGDAQRLPLLERNSRKSLLWTILRHPADRALSSYLFFEISRAGKIPNDDDLIEYCHKEKNAMVGMLTEGSLSNLTTIQQVLQELDFVAISERMPESLVVFRLLYGLNPEDVIVLPSKQKGQYDDGRSGYGCKKILSITTSPWVDDYMATDFVEDNDDFLLYAAANATLDRTIEAIGRNVVQQEVKRHVMLQGLAERKCTSKAKFPCMDGRIYTRASRNSCYRNDWGCGHECVRRVLKEHSRNLHSR